MHITHTSRGQGWMVRVYEDAYSRSTSQFSFNDRIYYRLKKKSLPPLPILSPESNSHKHTLFP